MTKLVIDVGTGPNTKDGDTVRNAFIKCNSNFDELYGSLGLDNTGTITSNLQGSVYDNNNNVMLDAVSGKLSYRALPDISTVKYEFKANFGQNGNLVSIENLPQGWAYTTLNNLATITHEVGKPPVTFSYWGYSLSQGLRLRFPTSGYQATRIPNAPYTFTLNLNSAVTGADNGYYALITVIF